MQNGLLQNKFHDDVAADSLSFFILGSPDFWIFILYFQ